ncbi:hypothetical protein BGX38DRAFT_1248019 [Terfezia claveryi]|nr:hypothetical protein BGX38DRAFT_1248019 [Terfezia claveryi]
MLVKNISVLVLAASGLVLEVVADMPSSSGASIQLRDALEQGQFGKNRYGGNEGRQTGGNNDQNGNNGGNTGGNADLTLDPANVQTGSQANDDANLINFCTGRTLTNGQQNRSGSCNGIVMGLPAAGQMVSTIIVSPQSGQNIAANTEFNVVLQVANLEAGTFTNPDNTYYSAPQTLKNGRIVGRTHVTIQDLGRSLDPTEPDAGITFAFFKGISDDGDGNGQLQAVVSDGLPAGFYRRGAQDDCIRFMVEQKQNNDGNNGGKKGGRGRGLTGGPLSLFFTPFLLLLDDGGMRVT